MQYKLLEILRCPVTRSKLTLKTITETTKTFDGAEVNTIDAGILFAETDWFFPVIKGIPRLCVEAFLDYSFFLRENMSDYNVRRGSILSRHRDLLKYVLKKNRRTKKSFTHEWQIFNYEQDRTWDAGEAAMVERFLTETDESMETLRSKCIFDAGCGNGKLNCLLAANGIMNVAMDFSNSIEVAAGYNKSANVHFIQGDVQFPPVGFNYFDIVHSSGVLIHTHNTELSFSCLVPTVKAGGKLSIWLYHPRKDLMHRFFNLLRSVTSKLPLRLQFYLYAITLFPLSYCVKRLKGNTQNPREMMVDILDWFTPEFRWEHGHMEAAVWFYKRQFQRVRVTTDGVFGFNIIGEKCIKGD